MNSKLYMSLIFSNLLVTKTLSLNRCMYNLYTKFVKILEICKQFSENLVNESGNVPRRGPVPKFSDLEVVALSLTAEAENIDSEKWLFDYKFQENKDSIPNLISRRQFNDRKDKKEDWDNILTTYRPALGHQEQCENNDCFVCQSHWQNQCTYHSAIRKLH